MTRWLIALPLLLDCPANLLLNGSFNESLSACAAKEHAKHQRFWGWTAGAIDFVFGSGHCESQRLREEKYHGVWAAWRAM